MIILEESILLDISTCYNEKDMISVLFKYEENTTKDILEYYLALYKILCNTKKLSYDILFKEILSAYSICNHSFQERNFIEENEKYDLFFTRLSDYVELIKDGLTGNMHMPRDLIDFLSNYHEDIAIFKELDFNVRGVRITEL